MQVLADDTGFPLRVSPVRCGFTHDLTAVRALVLPTLPVQLRVPQPERTKGQATRVHEAVNRTLATIALVLSIVALVGAIGLGMRADGYVSDISNTIGDPGDPGDLGDLGDLGGRSHDQRQSRARRPGQRRGLPPHR